MALLNNLHRTLLVALALCCGQATPNDAIAAEAAADLAFQGGAVYTLDAARTWSEAVAIRAGRIVFVGSNRQLKAYIGKSTRVVDLKGRMLLPAFQDAHIHPISAGLEVSACDLNGLTSAAEYVAAISKYAQAHPQATWITGGGWLMSAFGPAAAPAVS